MDERQAQGYLRDLAVLLRDMALDAKTRRDQSPGRENDYDVGYLMAFHEVVSLMQQQAAAFGIDPSELGLQDIDPERDLL